MIAHTHILKLLLGLLFCVLIKLDFAAQKPIDTDSLVQVCSRQLDQKNDSAYVLADYLFHKDSSLLTHIFLLAKSNYLQGQTAMGDFYLQKTLAKDSLYFSALFLKATKSLEKEDLTEANEQIQFIEKYFSNEPLTFYLQACLSAKKGETKSAILLLDTALLANPTFLEAKLKRADLLFKTQQYDKAIKDYESNFGFIANNPSELNNYGICLLNENDTIAAKKMFTQAITLDSTQGIFFYNLGLTFMKFGDFLKARNAFAKAVLLDVDFLDTDFLIAKCYESEGSLSLALKQYEIHQSKTHLPDVTKEIWLLKIAIFFSSYWYVILGSLLFGMALLRLLLKKKKGLD